MLEQITTRTYKECGNKTREIRENRRPVPSLLLRTLIANGRPWRIFDNDNEEKKFPAYLAGVRGRFRDGDAAGGGDEDYEAGGAGEPYGTDRAGK